MTTTPLPKLNLNALSSNFQEIYSSSSADKDPQLVANLWCSRIYNASNGWGRVWTWVYGVIQRISKKDLRQEKLQHAMWKLEALFEQQKRGIAQYAQRYREYLQQIHQGKPIKKSELSKLRHGITRWNSYITPFVTDVEMRKNAKIAQLFQKYLDRDLAKGSTESPFTCPMITRQLQKYQEIINLESLFYDPLPITILEKLALGKKLDKNASDHLKRWIKKLNETDTTIGIRRFHRILATLVEHLNSYSTNNPKAPKADLVTLELALIDSECKLFLQRDPEHIQWRALRKSRGELLYQDKTLILDQQLFGTKEESEDRTLVFTLKNDPDHVVVVDINEAMLALKKKLAEDHGISLKTPTVAGIDPLGRFAVVERLVESVREHKWKSSENQMSNHDRHHLKPIVNLLKWLLAQERTPQNLSVEHCMFDKKGELKCLKVPLEGEFDYEVLRKFAVEFANFNPRVSQHILEASGLSEYGKVTKFYQSVFENAIKGDQTAIEDVAGINRITDANIVNQAKQLHKEAIEVRDRCVKEVMDKKKIKDKKQVEISVNRNIISRYKQTSPAGTLWYSLEEDVIAKTLRDL